MSVLGDLEAAFLGILAIIFLVSFISYLYTGGKVYFYYAMYALCFGIYFGYKFYFESYMSESGRFRYHESEGISRFIQPLIYFNYYHFIINFLDMERRLPEAKKVVHAMANFNLIALIGLFAAAIFQMKEIEDFIYYGFRIVIIIVSVGLITYLFLLKKDILINLIIGGGLALLIGGMMAMMLPIYGIRLWDTDGLVWMIIGIIIELILFSCGLGYKTVQTEKEKNRLQNELILKMKENEKMLENREELVRRDLNLALENAKNETEQKLKTEFSLKEKEIELNVLRAQMNPHFLFNSLNSLKAFIQENDKDQATDYLDDFSFLVRKTLDDSPKKSIGLSEELIYIKKYVSLENLRLGNTINFEILNPENLDLDFIQIPPMILQPLVENSIWHGLSNSTNLIKNLVISFQSQNEYLKIIITDNGLGRKEAQKQKSIKKKNSISIQNIRDRLNILYPLESKVEISDLSLTEKMVGTKVEITFPF